MTKSFNSVLGDVHPIEKLQSDEGFISWSITITLKRQRNMCLPFSFQIHWTMNTSHVLISEPYLLYSTKEPLLKNLSDQNVVDVHRITVHGMIKYMLQSTWFWHLKALIYKNSWFRPHLKMLKIPNSFSDMPKSYRLRILWLRYKL